MVCAKRTNFNHLRSKYHHFAFCIMHFAFARQCDKSEYQNLKYRKGLKAPSTR